MTDLEMFGFNTHELRSLIQILGIKGDSNIKPVCPKGWTEEQRKRARSRWYHLTHRDQVNTTAWRAQLWREYGIDEATYWKILVDQGNCCAICKGTKLSKGRKRFHVDHDHTTGRVRGLLCSPCNSLLGFAHDNPAVLERAIAYLQKTVTDAI